MTPNASVTPMTIDNDMPSPMARKTPSDYWVQASAYHSDLDAAREQLQEAQAALDSLSERRISMIAAARDYGLTGAYARTLLRKV